MLLRFWLFKWSTLGGPLKIRGSRQSSHNEGEAQGLDRGCCDHPGEFVFWGLSMGSSDLCGPFKSVKKLLLGINTLRNVETKLATYCAFPLHGAVRFGSVQLTLWRFCYLDVVFPLRWGQLETENTKYTVFIYMQMLVCTFLCYITVIKH